MYRAFLRPAAMVTIAAATCLLPGAAPAKRPVRAPAGCAAFLVGEWAGAGTVAGFGPPMKVASTASYRRDGTFASSTRYRDRDGKWTEQETAGRWSVKPGKAARACTLALKSVSAIGEASSTSDFTIVDADTYRAFGVDLKRKR